LGRFRRIGSLRLLCAQRPGNKDEQAHDRETMEKPERQEPRRARGGVYQLRSPEIHSRIDATRAGEFLMPVAITSASGPRFTKVSPSLRFSCHRLIQDNPKSISSY